MFQLWCGHPEENAHALSEQSSVGPNDGCLRHCDVCHCRAPAHAQSSEYAAASPATIHVDCAATSRGAGSAKRPYWRITGALDSARQLRREGPGRIVIRVAPGICSGNFETQSTGQKTRSQELLPLVLNVPNLTLHGTGIMEYAEGYPVARRPGAATTVTVIYFSFRVCRQPGYIRRADYAMLRGIRFVALILLIAQRTIWIAIHRSPKAPFCVDFAPFIALSHRYIPPLSG